MRGPQGGYANPTGCTASAEQHRYAPQLDDRPPTRPEPLGGNLGRGLWGFVIREI